MSKRLQCVVFVGLFAALSYLLYLFPQFPVLPMFPWLKIDFSDVPALYLSVGIHPAAGLLVVVIKNLLRFLTASDTGGVGELSNFLIGAVYVVSAGVFSRLLKKTQASHHVLFGTLLAIPFQIICSFFVNFYLMIPLYLGSNVDVGKYITLGVIPFNLIKCLLAGTVFFLVYHFTFPAFSKIMRK